MCPDNSANFMQYQRQRAPLSDEQQDHGPGSSFRRRPESRLCHFSLDSGFRRSDGLCQENEWFRLFHGGKSA